MNIEGRGKMHLRSYLQEINSKFVGKREHTSLLKCSWINYFNLIKKLFTYVHCDSLIKKYHVNFCDTLFQYPYIGKDSWTQNSSHILTQLQTSKSIFNSMTSEVISFKTLKFFSKNLQYIWLLHLKIMQLITMQKFHSLHSPIKFFRKTKIKVLKKWFLMHV